MHGMMYFKLWKKITANLDYSTWKSLIIEGEIKTFYDKQKLN
jgi:hypothetical protein